MKKEEIIEALVDIDVSPNYEGRRAEKMREESRRKYRCQSKNDLLYTIEIIGDSYLCDPDENEYYTSLGERAQQLYDLCEPAIKRMHQRASKHAIRNKKINQLL
jgi:hypothetical protein